MKKIFFLLFTSLVLFISCKKDDKCTFTEPNTSAPTQERDSLRSYLRNNSLAAQEHTSGVFYNITSQGTGVNPGICSNVQTKYTGSFIPSGVIFDKTSPNSPGMSFTLGQVIDGWKTTLPLLKSGGTITLYIPPSMAYGSRNYPNDTNIAIPANSYLKFEVELVSVQ